MTAGIFQKGREGKEGGWKLQWLKKVARTALLASPLVMHVAGPNVGLGLQLDEALTKALQLPLPSSSPNSGQRSWTGPQGSSEGHGHRVSWGPRNSRLSLTVNLGMECLNP